MVIQVCFDHSQRFDAFIACHQIHVCKSGFDGRFGEVVCRWLAGCVVKRHRTVHFETFDATRRKKPHRHLGLRIRSPPASKQCFVTRYLKSIVRRRVRSRCLRRADYNTPPFT